MTAVRETVLRVPAADLGPESPLPAFTGLQRLADPASFVGVPDAMRERIAYGRLAHPLPYAVQDGYDRELRTREVPALELTNGRLQALVLPGLGGRLWSLRDLRTGRDLVFRNPRLQFANLALTNAWFAGGIEWNLGSTGHAATTCRPVFAGVVTSERGTLLRIWEWERTRDLVYAVDLLMPADRALLLAFVRVRNPDPEPKPLYWWTNVAVPEEPGARVLAPAGHAWRTEYEGTLRAVDVPFPDDPATDVSHPGNADRSVDYFFDLPGDRQRWIAALGADGTGLLQTSTAELVGRKLFCWGTGRGGRHWQEWLGGPGPGYLEIQAGSATTQLEHRPLAGDAEISWAEAYAPLDAGPTGAQGSWDEAVTHVDALVARAMPRTELDGWHRWWRDQVADAPPRQLSAGSGAGTAELLVRGCDPDTQPGTPFGQPRADGSRHLVALVRDGHVDQDAAGAEVLVPPVSDRWAPLLSPADGWWSALMSAIRAHARGDLDEAERDYRRSDEVRPTAWAVRGLAVLAVARGDVDAAAELYTQATTGAPDCLPLLVEAADVLVTTGRPSDALGLLDRAPAEHRTHGRVVLLRVRALLATGDVEHARTLLEEGFEVPDLREGETLGALWSEAFPGVPLPDVYDFRMVPEAQDDMAGGRPSDVRGRV